MVAFCTAPDLLLGGRKHEALRTREPIFVLPLQASKEIRYGISRLQAAVVADSRYLQLLGVLEVDDNAGEVLVLSHHFDNTM